MIPRTIQLSFNHLANFKVFSPIAAQFRFNLNIGSSEKYLVSTGRKLNIRSSNVHPPRGLCILLRFLFHASAAEIGGESVLSLPLSSYLIPSFLREEAFCDLSTFNRSPK